VALVVGTPRAVSVALLHGLVQSASVLKAFSALVKGELLVTVTRCLYSPCTDIDV